MVQRVRIMEEDWDNLIVLDGCRHDYFSKVYRSFLAGKLRKFISLGSSTIEWCKKSFRQRYDDVVYISANPYINSKLEVNGFDARNHFHRVVDVWDWGWDGRLGTVHPAEVNKAVKMAKKRYPDKRFIIHYLQPHSPYIGANAHILGFPKPDIARGRVLGGIANNHCDHSYEESDVLPRGFGFVSRFLVLGSALTERIFRIGNLEWRAREFLGLPAASPMDAMRRKAGAEGLRKAYLDNLKLVLEYVALLTKALSGTIVVTSDHGERLGERGSYSHVSGSSDPLLLEVPWFEVEKGSVREISSGVEEIRIKQRVKQLKELGKI